MLLFPLIGTGLCALLIYSFKHFIIAQYAGQSPLFTQYFDLLLPLAMAIGFNIALNAYATSLFKTSIITFLEGIIARIVFIIIVVLYYLKWIDFTQFVNLFVLNYLLQVLFMCLYIFKVDTPSWKMDTNYFKSIGINKLIGFGLLLTATNISSLSLKHFDAILIGKYYDLTFVGIFTVTAYISLIIEIPLNSLERISSSKIAQAFANNDFQSIQTIYYKSVKYLMLLGGLLLVGIISTIRDLLSFLPAIYHNGFWVTIISSCAAFLNVATGVNTSIIFNSTKYFYGTILLFVLMIVAVVLNVVLIPVYGIVGAALATGLLAVLYNVSKYVIILIHFKMQPYNSSSLKIILVIVISFLTSCLLPTIDNKLFSILLKTASITTVYGGLTYLLKIVPEFHKYIPFAKSRAK